MAWVPSDQRWLQVTNQKTDDSLTLISTAGERSDLWLQDWAKLGVNLSVGTGAVVDPEEPLEIPSFLVLAKGSEAYKNYQCLEDYICPFLIKNSMRLYEYEVSH